MVDPRNWTARKRASVAAGLRAEARFGWRRAGPQDRWDKLDCPAGILAHGGRVNAHCSSIDCSRRIHLNAQWWVEKGHGDTNLSVIQRAYGCARLPCGPR